MITSSFTSSIIIKIINNALTDTPVIDIISNGVHFTSTLTPRYETYIIVNKFIKT